MRDDRALREPVVEAPASAGPAETAPAAPRPITAARNCFAALLTSHALIDIFPMFFTSLMLVLQNRLQLAEWQTIAVYMATPIFSGMSQPFFAHLADKHDSRIAAPLGLAVGAVCVSSIGFATSFWQLIALQIVGVIGTGVYHPVSTALAGQTGARTLSGNNGRALAIGAFIAAGMLGHTVGPIFATRVNAEWGMQALVVCIPAGLVMAFLLHLATRRVPHRHADHAESSARIDAAERARRVRAVAVLASQNALRFLSQVGMFVMFNTWAKSKVLATPALTERAEQAGADKLAADVETGAVPAATPALREEYVDTAVAEIGSIYNANLTAAMTIGMGVFVMLSGRIVRSGGERMPLLVFSLIGAVFVALIGPAGDGAMQAWGLSEWSIFPAYLCAALAPIGFFGTFPIATSLAQRLLPGNTGLVTSLMMGVGWTIGALSTPLAVVFFGFVFLNEAPEVLSPLRINIGFFGFAALLALAGLLSLLLPKDLVAKVAHEK